MPNVNLDRRLQQRGRRSGIMVGLSMLAAMGVIVAGFALIFTMLEPLVVDFAGSGEETTSAAEGEPQRRTAQPTAVPDSALVIQGQPTEVAEPMSAESSDIVGELEPTATAETFAPDYRISAVQRINLRAGPGTNFDVVVVLAPGTELVSLDEDETTGGNRWLRFRTEDGDEGWIREIDVDPLNR